MVSAAANPGFSEKRLKSRTGAREFWRAIRSYVSKWVERGRRRRQAATDGGWIRFTETAGRMPTREILGWMPTRTREFFG